MLIRNYNQDDYPQVEALYKDSSTFGGQYDDARDSSEQLKKLIGAKSNAILVAENSGQIIGTVTLFEDGRSAWLYRFTIAGVENKEDAAQELYSKASNILKAKGHTQVLVYAPAGDKTFDERYTNLGFNKGGDFTAYWQDLK